MLKVDDRHGQMHADNVIYDGLHGSRELEMPARVGTLCLPRTLKLMTVLCITGTCTIASGIDLELKLN
jgi:hypothetical protein